MDDRIVNDVPGFWQEVARGAIWVASSISLLFVAAVRWWVGSRFKRVDDTFAEHKGEIDSLKSHSNKQDVALAEIRVHIENSEEGRKEIKNSISKLHEKLDRALERAG